MAAPVNVYGPPLSTAVSRVLACLIEKDVQFQLIPVNMAKGEHKSPQYLKIQVYNYNSPIEFPLKEVFLLRISFDCEKPFGQVPAFEDENISLFGSHTESRAICRYICDKYSNQGNKGLYGTNPLVKASIDQWIEAEGQTFNPPSSIIMFQLFFGPRMKIEKDEDLIKKNEEKLSKVLDVYDKRLGEYRYLAGDEFTLADLSHLPNTQLLIHGTDRGELFTSRKNVARWWDEISGRESWKKVVEMQNPTPS